MSDQALKVELANDLYTIGALKFGEFTFKSGIVSPMYLDLRLFVSYPKIMKKIAKLYAAQLEGLEYDRLAGVAYAALPIAGAVSLEIEKPWIFVRKEALKKDYGLQKAVEGEYHPGERIVMIEDLVTRATSLLEAIPVLESYNVTVKDAVVLLDYQKGGSDKLAEAGYTLHSFATVREMIDIMHDQGNIDDAMHERCVKFLAA